MQNKLIIFFLSVTFLVFSQKKEASKVIKIKPKAEFVTDLMSKMTLEEKMAKQRAYREDQYEKLLDAVYFRRGWNKNGVPTVEHLKKIGMDLPELIEVVKPLQ